MVGLVVVSHSRALAAAAVSLATEMLSGSSVSIEVAAGLDDGAFGTDAVAISEAIAAADAGEGVVVLMDLGSAVLSAETALEFLDDDLRERVVLCPGPLVEGLVVAAVSAAGGASTHEVATEARNALMAKESQLGEPVGSVIGSDAPLNSAAVDRFTVRVLHGLHARPAAALVRLVADSDAQVEFRNATTGSNWVPGSSLSRVATLGALQGHEVEMRASGPDAKQVVDRVKALADSDFGESAVPMAAPARSGLMAASPGIGLGPARPLRSSVDLEAVPETPAADVGTERLRLEEAAQAVRDDVDALRSRVDPSEAAIFGAHLALLDDPDLIGAARIAIDEGQAAPQAWAEAVKSAAARFTALADPYLRARAADVQAVGEQVLAVLLGAGSAVVPEGVLVADDLSPALAATLDSRLVKAVVLASGSPTAHSAILLRTRGIPAVVGAGPSVLQIAEGTLVAVDGGRGEFVVAPNTAERDDFEARAADLRARTESAAAASGQEALTKEGVRVLVGANVGSLADAQAAGEAGADLIGLVRTEFLFLDRASAPSVEEQESIYRSLAEAVGGRRITLRSLDVGGDKPLPYLRRPPEANPFLGVRGLRLSQERPDLLADQLLAVVRVAHDTPVSLMFPMITTVDEVLWAREALAEAVSREGRGEPAELQVGIMVEVPAAALKAAALAPYVDFFSIGTNDLTQYTLAAERGNASVAGLADPLDPAVLRLISETVRGAGDRLVAVCGELAADEKAAGVLTGLGVRELSVPPIAVPLVKQAVREVSEPGEIAGRVVVAPSAAAVRALLGH